MGASYFRKWMAEVIKIKSTLTCINCGHKKRGTMPGYASQTEYRCNNCNSTIAVKQSDCCVYCSYGSVPCPPEQRSRIEKRQRCTKKIKTSVIC